MYLNILLGLCFSARKYESMRNGRRSFHVTHGVTNPRFQVRDQRADRFMATYTAPYGRNAQVLFQSLLFVFCCKEDKTKNGKRVVSLVFAKRMNCASHQDI